MSSMLDQGPPQAGPPPPDAGPPQGPPPALLALLAAHAHAQGGGLDAEGPGDPQPEEDDRHEPIKILTQAIALFHRYLQVEPDQEDKAAVAKLLALVQGLLAKDQKDAEAALGGGPATRVLRKLG